MNRQSLLSLLSILFMVACVDRVYYDINTAALVGISIDGQITTDPGPYVVRISREFDIDSRDSLRRPVTVKEVRIFDNLGEAEILTEDNPGVYRTQSNGIRGKVGRVYSLRVTFPDGQAIESIPDTLQAAGSLDTLYTDFNSIVNADLTRSYGFDVYFNASAAAEGNYRYMWRLKGTFQSKTSPEEACTDPQATVDCAPCGPPLCNECNYCNYKLPCTGLRNISRLPTLLSAQYVRVGPCLCCTCWYDFFNNYPVLSDTRMKPGVRQENILIHRVPLNPWMFQEKVHIEVSQMTLSARAYEFFDAIRIQKDALNSLFQPVTGRMPRGFVNADGSIADINGIFYAAGKSSKTMVIRREDVIPESLIPPTPRNTFSCFDLFPFATNKKPDFW